MDLGDVAGWAAFAISGVALVFSIKAQRDGRRSANAAEESVKEARRSGDAAVRSAVAAELTLADQQRAAEEQSAAEAEARRPKVKLRIEYVSGNLFHLVNDGRAPAQNVRLAEVDPAVNRWPTDLVLRENEAHTFFMAGGLAYNIPATLKVTWDGLAEPASVRVPSNSAE